MADLDLHLDPADEYTHAVEDDPTFNESMYFNLYDPTERIGGFFRLGNRPNEGHAEMTLCIYLPSGEVAFMFGRPSIDGNEGFDAGGLRFDTVDPFEALRVTYSGPAARLGDPLAMRDPKRAFAAAERIPCEVELDYRGLSPVLGGEAQGPFAETGLLASFARGHYEQHVGVRGRIAVGERAWELDGYGLRDHSWGPRSWQAPLWYRWLTCNAGPDHGFMVSVIATRDGAVRSSGVLFEDGGYTPITSAAIETERRGPERDQAALVCRASTADREIEIAGTVLSLIPLRHRRDGEVTRIGEGLTEYRWEGRIGYGLAEYLDQIDKTGRPAEAT